MDLLTLEACEIARAVLHLIPETEARPRESLAAAEAWARRPGPETRAAVERVRDAAWFAGSDMLKASNPAAAAAAFAVWHAVGSFQDQGSPGQARVYADAALALAVVDLGA